MRCTFIMAFQVDFFTVGNKSKSGDAIALRFGNLHSGIRTQQFVAVIDGGFIETGQKLVEHIKTCYGTTTVDAVISTHPDADHSSGLEPVMTDLTVGRLYMHQPWFHTDDIAKMFKDGRVTDNSVAAGIRKSLEDVRSLETIANRKRVPIVEPFTGVQLGLDEANKIIVLGPNPTFYNTLLPEFRCTPAAKGKGMLAAIYKLLEAGKEAVLNVAEDYNIETLQDPSEDTHAENNSSVVSFLRAGGRDSLFTADAGMAALTNVLDLMDGSGYSPQTLKFIQVPHHGSKRNVGPTLLNRLLGPKRSDGAILREAYVSACVDGQPKHPSLRVLNAFNRRGAPVYQWSRGLFLYHEGAPRENYAPVTPSPLYSNVEE
jgi:beta-lactamase superfamily II metal-dependent hydrolase